MATAAQVRANRVNARKSTGPRTAAGKERASQNAVKHGLSAREAVSAGEDPEEFEIYRAGMLEELAPAGPVETLLAERVVGLSWRLRRAERLQNAALAALDEGTPTPVLDGDPKRDKSRLGTHARLGEWKRLKGSQVDRSVAGVVDEKTALGCSETPASLARDTESLTAVGNHGRDAHATELPGGVTRGTGSLPVVGDHGQDASLFYTSQNARTGILIGKPHVSPKRRFTTVFIRVYPDRYAAPHCQKASFMPQKRHPFTPTPQKMCRTMRQDAHATETPDGVTTNPVGHHSSIPSFQPYAYRAKRSEKMVASSR